MNVVVTGAASGIGLALSLLYLQKGDTVIMVDKDRHTLNEEAQKLSHQFLHQVHPYICDITQIDEVNHLVEWTYNQVEHVDYLYNNAGIIGTLAPVWQLEPEQLTRVLEVNVYGILHMIRAFFPFFLKQERRAHIINMASLYAVCSGSHVAAYAMSKHAVLALTEALYFDMQHHGANIDLSVALPSFTDTALLAQHASEHSSTFHRTLNSLMAHSRPALEVAEHIKNAVENKIFYIIPDNEVKEYSNARIQSLVAQDTPHVTTIEKLISSLWKRSGTH